MENTAHIFLFHRAWIQFIGGMGFVMMMVMIVQSKQAMSLFHAEGHTDNIAPNLKRTARTVFVMFLALFAVAQFCTEYLACKYLTAYATVWSALSTAGFSTKATSIGYYNSLPIEIITEVLMIIGIINFAVLLMMLKGKFKKLFKVTEVRFGLFLIAVLSHIAGVGLVGGIEYVIWRSDESWIFQLYLRHVNNRIYYFPITALGLRFLLQL